MVAATIATVIVLPKIIVRRIVDSSTGIPKGTLLYFTGLNTVAANTGDNQPFAGIAVEEKSATETDVVTIGAAIDGVWDISTTNAAITFGVMVSIGGTNQCRLSVGTADLVNGSHMGRAEETRDGGTDRIRVRLAGY